MPKQPMSWQQLEKLQKDHPGLAAPPLFFPSDAKGNQLKPGDLVSLTATVEAVDHHGTDDIVLTLTAPEGYGPRRIHFTAKAVAKTS